MPEAIEVSWDTFQTLAPSDSSGFFWSEWYQSFLDAKPMNWELQKEIALIPNDDWEKGVEYIAEVIETIKARF